MIGVFCLMVFFGLSILSAVCWPLALWIFSTLIFAVWFCERATHGGI